MKKLFACMLAVCMIACSIPAAFAADIDTAGGTGTTPVTLTAEATTFSVTVPTSIAIHVNADGTVTCPGSDAVKITNNSAGPVRVTKIDMKNGEWSLVSYNGGDRSALASAGVDSDLLGFQMTANTDVVATAAEGDQTLTHVSDKWVIAGVDTGSNQLPIECAAIASALSAEIAAENAQSAASVIFTISWDTTTP